MARRRGRVRNAGPSLGVRTQRTKLWPNTTRVMEVLRKCLGLVRPNGASGLQRRLPRSLGPPTSGPSNELPAALSAPGGRWLAARAVQGEDHRKPLVWLKAGCSMVQGGTQRVASWRPWRADELAAPAQHTAVPYG